MVRFWREILIESLCLSPPRLALTAVARFDDCLHYACPFISSPSITCP